MKKTLGSTLVLLFLLLSFNRADAAKAVYIFDESFTPCGEDWIYMNKLEKIIFIEGFKEGMLSGTVNCYPLLPKNSEVANNTKEMILFFEKTSADVYIWKIDEWYGESEEFYYIPIHRMMTLVAHQEKYKLNKQEIKNILKGIAKQYNVEE